MGAFITQPSLPLLAANQRLHELRILAQAERRLEEANTERYSRTGDDLLRALPDLAVSAPAESVAAAASLPAHLGWGSEALTAVLRHRHQESHYIDNHPDRSRSGHLPTTAVTSAGLQAAKPPLAANEDVGGANKPQSGEGVKVYPNIALGMLRQEQAAAGRIWLLARHLDVVGAGWLRIDIIRQHLTDRNSKLHVCGWRQLRNLLKRGEGVFWQRDEQRIWLRSAAKVAHALDVMQLTGRPVSVPLSALLGGIGDVRAHLYASFHSGRVKEQPHGAKATFAAWSPPVARDTLTAVSGVGRASQRAYEARTRTQVQRNFAVGEAAEEAHRERCAWQQGQALFELKDYRGEQGRKGKTYLAWQLPNTYIGRHQQRPKGRQKRINRELKDLVMKGMPGNIGRTNVTLELALTKRYYPNGKLAAQAYGRQVNRQRSDYPLYWRRHRTGNGRFHIWQKLGGGE